jgi:hypothetical protein
MPSSQHLETLGPAYGSGSLSDVLPSALAVLGVPGGSDRLGFAAGPLADVRRFVVLLLDGFGFHLLSQASQASSTVEAIHHGGLGLLGSITATVPSSTPISLASLSTGTHPGDHGIIGFNVRVPETGAILTHIRWDDTPDPETWQPQVSCFELAAADGVACAIVSNSDFRDTGLTRAIYRGADWIPASTPDEVAGGSAVALGRGSRSLVYAYLPDVDTAGHFHGVGSPKWLDAVARVAEAIDGILTDLPSDAALVVTADHGMVNVTRRIRLDRSPELMEGVEAVAGDGRIRYVHTVPGAIEDVAAAWRARVDGRADILTRDQAIDLGWFGPVPERHRARVGDLVVVCRETLAIVGAPGEPPHVARLIGQHGGLTAAEMAVPLWIYRNP